MTDEELEAIRERAEKATPGPWTTEQSYDGDPDTPVLVGDGEYLCASPDDGVRGGHLFEDADFIAHAREDVPALVAEIELLRATLRDRDDELRIRDQEDAESEDMEQRAITADRRRGKAQAEVGRLQWIIVGAKQIVQRSRKDSTEWADLWRDLDNVLDGEERS
jgi:hypothetical protein